MYHQQHCSDTFEMSNSLISAYCPSVGRKLTCSPNVTLLSYQRQLCSAIKPKILSTRGCKSEVNTTGKILHHEKRLICPVPNTVQQITRKGNGWSM